MIWMIVGMIAAFILGIIAGWWLFAAVMIVWVRNRPGEFAAWYLRMTAKYDHKND